MLAFVLWAPQAQEAGGAAMQVDNLGFVYATESGCSTDEIIYTLSKCLKDVADGLGIQVAVFHTGRRTSVGDQIADDLSKGKLENLEDLMGDSLDIGLGLSRELLNWLRFPRVDMDLGRRVLVELARTTNAVVMEGFDFARATATLTC